MKKKKLEKLVKLQSECIDRLQDNIEQLKADCQDLSGTIDVMLDEDLINEIQKVESS